MEQKKTSLEPSRSFRRDALRSIGGLSLVALLLAIAVNLLVSKLPLRYTNLDTTNIGLYSLSESTDEVLDTLTQPITLYLAAQYGKEDSTILSLLERYADHSKQLRVEQIDPVLSPDALRQYSHSLEANSVIVASGDRFRVLKPSEFYLEQQYYVGGVEDGQYVKQSYFAGEQTITGAIRFVSSGVTPKLYLLTGHGEPALPGYLEQALAYENLSVAPLHLATVAAVPADADLLLLYAPAADLQETETKMLLDYLRQGGKLLMVGGGDPAATPQLSALAAYYGIRRVEGMLAETNSNYYLEQYPTYLLANVGAHPITQPILNRGYFILSPMSQGFVPIGGARESIQTAAILYTTESAVSLSAAAPGETSETLANGPFTVGLALAEGESRMVWFSSPHLLLEDVNALSSGANCDLFLNAVNWCYDFDGGISIRPKSMMMEYLTIRSEIGRWLGLLLVVILPLSVLLAGGWLLRRRGKR